VFQEIQEDHAFPILKDSAHHFTSWWLCLELLLWWEIHMSPLHGLSFWSRLVVAIPRPVTGDDAVQETVTFSFVVVQQVLTDLHSVVFMCLCEHPWVPLGTNFAIFQHCQHRFQLIEADIQLRTQFPGPNHLTRADELTQALFISWADSCAGPSGTWPVSHIAVATAEAHHPSPHCAHIHCWSLYTFHKHHWMPMGATVSVWRNSVIHLCFICTSMSDTILSDCPSAAICRTATELTNY
jgi:hypothetical protein